MTHHPIKKHKVNILKTIILLAALLMLAIVFTWHLLLPIFGISVIAFSAGLWNVAIMTIVLVCVCSLLFFVFTGIGVLFLSGFVLVWAMIAIILFPLIFPLVLPALLLMGVIALVVRKSK